MLPVRLINTADCYNLVLHLRFVSGSLTEINWSVAASCGLMLPVTSDLFGGFYWSCARFTALLGFICPGENRGENTHLLHLNTQCSTQHNTQVHWWEGLICDESIIAHRYWPCVHFTFEYMVSFVKVLLKSRARLYELIVRKVQGSETFNSVIKALLQTTHKETY